MIVSLLFTLSLLTVISSRPLKKEEISIEEAKVVKIEKYENEVVLDGPWFGVSSSDTQEKDIDYETTLLDRFKLLTSMNLTVDDQKIMVNMLLFNLVSITDKMQSFLDTLRHKLDDTSLTLSIK